MSLKILILGLGIYSHGKLCFAQYGMELVLKEMLVLKYENIYILMGLWIPIPMLLFYFKFLLLLACL